MCEYKTVIFNVSFVSPLPRRLYPVLFVLVVAQLAGAETGGIAGEVPRTSVHYAETTPLMTAEAKDPAWNRAESFTLSQTVGGATGLQQERTKTWLLWREEFLYVRFVCVDKERYTHPDPASPVYKSDVAEVFFDPRGDGRQWMEIQADVQGRVFDKLFLLTDKPRSGPDGVLLPEVDKLDRWDFDAWEWLGVKTAVSRSDSGWIVDIALPAKPTLRRLGLNSYRDGLELRANFVRYDWREVPGSATRSLVSSNWSPVAFGNPHKSPLRMGFIDLVR